MTNSEISSEQDVGNYTACWHFSLGCLINLDEGLADFEVQKLCQILGNSGENYLMSIEQILESVNFSASCLLEKTPLAQYWQLNEFIINCELSTLSSFTAQKTRFPIMVIRPEQATIKGKINFVLNNRGLLIIPAAYSAAQYLVTE